MSGPPLLLAITDTRAAGEAEHLSAYRAVAARLPPGLFAVQLREPGRDARPSLAFARALVDDVLGPFGGELYVNDRLDLALALGARGVHLGGRSVSPGDARALLGPGVALSRACHASGEVARAVAEGASVALLSPIFATPGKGPPLGLGALREAARGPGAGALVALGGVEAGNAAACLQAGARGVAAVRALLEPGSASALVAALEPFFER
ncbi:MAG TPA: thiamine phosphate synthase [Polyangiaceae bacterium]|nr:thiamine phosphate synthase [Polyangiaceae bacterium]